MSIKLKNNRAEMQEAIDMASIFLSESEIKNAQYFLDYDEIGIAFQELCGSLCERDLKISKQLKEKLLHLYDILEGDSELFWQEIKLKNHILNMKFD